MVQSRSSSSIFLAISSAFAILASPADWLIYLGKYAAHEQLAHFLYKIYLRLKRINAVEDNSFFMPLTQELISDALGMSPVHVSRTFSMLREEGLVIRKRQHVTLPDPEALARLVEFNDSYIDEFLPPTFSELLRATP